jgi:seryl-tRNA synthetase
MASPAGHPLNVALPAGTALTGEAAKTFREQIYYVDSAIEDCALADGAINLTLQTQPADAAALADKVVTLATKTVESFRRVQTKTVFEFVGQPTNDQDPFPHLTQTRQVIPSGIGTFTYQGTFLKVMRGLDEFFRRFAVSLDAVEQSYPTTVPANNLATNGYLGAFPHHALLVSAAKNDFDSLGALSGAVAAGETPPLSAPTQALSPTVCYHCFESLKAQQIPAAGALFSGTAHCHRNEGKNVTTLARLQTFTMRELIFFGPAPAVEKRRQQIMDHARDTVKAWGLACKLLTACDPFFVSGAQAKRAYQSAMALKYELQVTLPHLNDSISCASFNHHQGTLVKSYEITGQGGAALQSGCVGYGFERLAYALYSQFGTAVETWPGPVRTALFGG